MLLISVIVPVYNVAPFIDRCIHSIIMQDRCGASIECIIVDDCSPDNSMEIVHSNIDNYDGGISFTIIEHHFNKGLSAARNSGIDVAQGDFLFFLDSDDWLPSGSFSAFVSTIKENPNVDMVVGNHFCKKQNTSFPHTIAKQLIIDNKQLRKDMLNYQNIICNAWNKMISVRFFSDKKNRFPEGIIYEDIYWSYFLFKDIKKSIVLPNITYIYTNNQTSITNTCKTKQNISLYFNSYNKIISAIADNPYHDLYPESFLYILPILISNTRLCSEYNINNNDTYTLYQLVRKIIHRILSDKRFFLATYITMLIYPPFSLLLNNAWVRRHYDNIDKTARLLAIFFERFHRNSIKSKLS